MLSKAKAGLMQEVFYKPGIICQLRLDNVLLIGS
jgi:hypothetical protein